MTTKPETGVEASGPGLLPNEIGLSQTLFNSVAATSPALAVCFSIAVGASYAGGALPLSVLFGLVACMLIAVCIGQMAKHVPSAGGLPSYAARAIHPNVGALAAWAYLLVWPLFAPLLYVLFGHLLGSYLETELGWSYDAVWPIATTACALGVAALGYRGVKISTNVGIALGAIEVVFMVVLAAWLIVKAGDRNTLAVFGDKFATIPGFEGANGIFAGMVWAIFGFIGFENTVPLAEETRDPRFNIPRAVIYATLIVGILYVFGTYAETVFFGPDRMGDFFLFNDGNPWYSMTHDAWGGVGVFFLMLVLLNSCFGSANGANNGASRNLYSWGRSGILPANLSRTHKEHRTPHVAILILLIVNLAVTLGLGWHYGPLTAFALMGAIFTALIILLYMLTAVSCFVYYWRFERAAFNPLLHGLIPLASIAVLVPALLADVGYGGSLFSFVSPLPAPLDKAGIIVIVWLVLGFVYTGFMASRYPDRIRLNADDERPADVAHVRGTRGR
jgi:amino acid transporter